MKTTTSTLYCAANATPVEVGLPQHFSGVCYSGGVIPGYGQMGDSAIDLSSLQVPDKDMFALVNHDPNQRAGKCRLVNHGTHLAIEGEFLSTKSGSDVATEFSQGAPWEFSVGINMKAQATKTPRTLTINGQSLTVQTLFSQAKVREVSFVPAGADPNTQAVAFAMADSTEEDSMNEELTAALDAEKAARKTVELALTESQEKVTSLCAELETVKTELATANLAADTANAAFDAVTEELTTVRLSIREQAVKALFSSLGRDYTAELAAPYIALPNDAFALLNRDVTEFSVKQHDQVLFEEVATQGADVSSTSSKLDLAVGKLIELNPKLTKEQATAQALRQDPSLYTV